MHIHTPAAGGSRRRSTWSRRAACPRGSTCARARPPEIRPVGSMARGAGGRPLPHADGHAGGGQKVEAAHPQHARVVGRRLLGCQPATPQARPRTRGAGVPGRHEEAVERGTRVRVVQERRVAAREHGKHVHRRIGAAERVVQARARAARRGLVVAVAGRDERHGRLLVRADVRQQPECAVVHARAQVELQLEQPVALRLGDVVRQQRWRTLALLLSAQAGAHAEEEEEQQRGERTGETDERGAEVGSEGEEAANRITRGGVVSHWHHAERAPRVPLARRGVNERRDSAKRTRQ
eukprot:scaffold131223_cov42-Phaeocystis_antarctica.AAC.1